MRPSQTIASRSTERRCASWGAEMPTSVDVLVIGAGPVGLALANELTRGGATVRVVDKAPAIREISKALIWHVRTQEALDKIGILQRGRAEAKPLTEVVMRAYGKRIGSWRFSGIDSPHPHALIIGQNRTQHLLLDLLHERGADVSWNTEAVALDVSRADICAATLRSTGDGGTEEVVHARYVVGCEGSNSLVRKTLGLTFEGERYSAEQFVQADCKIAWSLPSGRSYLFLTDDGYMMVIEMPGDLVRIFISLPDKEGTTTASGGELGAVEDMHVAPTLDEIRSNFARLTGIDPQLSDATWLARYRTSHRAANTFRKGRCFVAGDAGHVHVPIGGQGMNTGIQDAFNLGWKLAGVVRGTYREEILDSYDDERRPVAQALLRGTDRSYRGILHPSELQQRLVRMFGPFVVRTDVAQDFVSKTLEELTIAYAHTALNRDLGGTSGPKPGERAPVNAPLVRAADMRTVLLADVTREAAWVLLVLDGDPDHRGSSRGTKAHEPLPARFTSLVSTYRVTMDATAEESVELPTLIDAEGHLHRAYGVSQTAFYLLRPDGVVAMRGATHDLHEVETYLDALLADAPAAAATP